MNAVRLVPVVTAEDSHLRGQTGWLVRLLCLFSYVRSVDIDRNRRRITVRTIWLWIFRREQVIDFEQVRRIVCQAQGMPSESALFLISLALEGGRELPLFTVWEQQPRERDWLDKLAGEPRSDLRVGDEAAVSIIDLLREYLCVPIARR
jgi:hypothetical protein